MSAAAAELSIGGAGGRSAPHCRHESSRKVSQNYDLLLPTRTVQGAPLAAPRSVRPHADRPGPGGRARLPTADKRIAASESGQSTPGAESARLGCHAVTLAPPRLPPRPTPPDCAKKMPIDASRQALLGTEHPVPVLRKGFARRALRLAGPYWNSRAQVAGARRHGAAAGCSRSRRSALDGLDQLLEPRAVRRARTALGARRAGAGGGVRADLRAHDRGHGRAPDGQALAAARLARLADRAAARPLDGERPPLPAAVQRRRARQPRRAHRRGHPHRDRDRDRAGAHAGLLAADAGSFHRHPVDGVRRDAHSGHRAPGAGLPGAAGVPLRGRRQRDRLELRPPAGALDQRAADRGGEFPLRPVAGAGEHGSRSR